MNLSTATSAGAPPRVGRKRSQLHLCRRRHPATGSRRRGTHPLETAGFPLFPFSGRINHGCFAWNGRTVQLAPNFPPESHAIHGQAWLKPWDLEHLESGLAHLSYRHAQDEWPWAYRAEQSFELTGRGLRLTLSISNLSDETMPAGLGWHPYFPRQDALLSADVSGIWTAASGMIPDQLAPLTAPNNLRSARPVDLLDLDNAFTVSAGQTGIAWPARQMRVRMEASGRLNHLVVYVPKGQDFFCVEPVSHAPDAVNSVYGRETTGLRELAPGENLSASIDIAVERI
ncbi:MAG: aldose 1-epimerase [Hyphomonas sp.]